MPVYTVLGPIEPGAIGITSMHEHCISDATTWTSPGREPEPVDRSVRIENLGFIRWNFDTLEDNLKLEDPDVAASELASLRDIPGATIVDLTPTHGLGGDALGLQRISAQTGVHIVAGCGYYVGKSHPADVSGLGADDLAGEIVRDLCDGIRGTAVRAGIIGEIGTSNPPTVAERKVVAAASQAAIRTGAAINIHLDPFGHHALDLLKIIDAEGAPLDRVVLSHLDAYTALDDAYHREIAATGAILEFDNFGLENYTTQTDRLLQNNTDMRRMEHAARLIEDGLARQLVFGSDVYTKAQLKSYGGAGYEHLTRRIAPALRTHFGIAEEALDQVLVENPRRLLNRPALPASEPAR